MTLGIIGAGAWGTALACVASENVDVVLYTRDNARAATMRESRSNDVYLPNVEIPSNVSIVSSKEEFESVEHVVVAVPSIGFRDTISEFSFLGENVGFVSVTKGLEQTTNLRMSQVIHDADAQRNDSLVAVLSGPNLAQEVGTGHPAATVIASHNTEFAEKLQSYFHTKNFRVYTSEDVVGCEIAGVAKNVVAIAVGIGDGMGYGDNSKATVMTRALAEITRLGVAEGGAPATFSGLAGIGDLIATCVSELSRNRNVGYQLGLGKTIAEISDMTHDIAEGVFSAKALSLRAKDLGVEMPIVNAVAQTVEDGKVSPDALKQLMSRPPGRE